MFCRSCHYDLRGQTDPRCPECGRAFDFVDPASYLGALPTRAGRALTLVRRSTPFLLTAVTLGLVGYHALASSKPSMPHCGVNTIGLIGETNLRYIVVAMLNLRHKHPEETRISIERLKQEATRSLSPREEHETLQRRYRWRYQTSRPVRNLLWPLLGYAVLMSLAIRKRRSRLSGVFAASAVLLVIAMGALHVPGSLGRIFWPDTLRYIDDFVVLDGIDSRTPADQSGAAVMAYDKKAYASGKRPVGFMDGRIRWLADGELRAALAAQGRTLQPPPPE